MEGKSDITHWSVPVNISLYKALEEALEKAGYRTKTEFIRDAVRRRLEELEIKLNKIQT